MMVYVLNKRERTALEALESETRFQQGDFIDKGKLPPGIGDTTLGKLVELGLAEKGPSKRYHGAIGYRTTENAEICMYGATWAEIEKLPKETKLEPVRIWSWPPNSTQPIEHKTRRKIPMLEPRLKALKPRLKSD